MDPTVEPVMGSTVTETRVVTMTSKHNPSWSHLISCTFCNNLCSLNIRHFGMFEAKGLNIWCRRHFQWQDLPTKLHQNIPIS
jgi:hypothetical protein